MFLRSLKWYVEREFSERDLGKDSVASHLCWHLGNGCLRLVRWNKANCPHTSFLQCTCSEGVFYDVEESRRRTGHIRTERDIFEFLALPYLEPWQRCH